MRCIRGCFVLSVILCIATLTVAAQQSESATKQTPNLAKLGPPQESLQEADALYRAQQYSEAFSKYLDVHVSGDSAQQGEAALKIGMMYLNGNGVLADIGQARTWLQKAAIQGNTVAKNELAKLDAPPPAPAPTSIAQSQPQTAVADQAQVLQEADALYRAQQYSEAFSKYLDVEVSGDSEQQSAAELKIGMMYVSGNGVQAELGHARYWLLKAAGQGNQAAKSELAKLDAPPPAPAPTQEAESQPVATAQAPAYAAQPAAQQMTKNDIDASDVAAFQQELNTARTTKLVIKTDNRDLQKAVSTLLKACNDANHLFIHQYDARTTCYEVGDMNIIDKKNPPAQISVTISGGNMIRNFSTLTLQMSDVQQAFLRGCSLPAQGADGSTQNPCLGLGAIYMKQAQYKQALLVYRSSSCEDGAYSSAIGCGIGMLNAYRMLGNEGAEAVVMRSLCFDEYVVDACRKLQESGIPVDIDSVQSRHDQATQAESQARAAARDQATAEGNKQPGWLTVLSAVADATGPADPSSGSSGGSSSSSGNAINDALAEQQRQLAATAATIQEQKAAQAAHAAQMAAQQKAAAEQAELSRQQAAQAAALKQKQAQQAALATANNAPAAKPAPSPVRVAYYYKGQTYQSYAALLAAARASGNCDPQPEMGGQAPCDNASANAQAPPAPAPSAQGNGGQSPQSGTQSTASKGQIWWVGFAFSPISSVAASLSGDGSFGVGTSTNEQAASDSALNHCDAVDTSDMRCNTGGTWEGTPDGSVRWYALAINRNARPVDDLHPWSYGVSVGYTSQSGAEQNALAICQIPNADGCAIVVSASVGGTN